MTTMTDMRRMMAEAAAKKKELESLDIVSWTGFFLNEDEEVTMYSSQHCPADDQIIQRRLKETISTGLSVSGMLMMIVLKARDESGNRLFKLADFDELKELVGTDKVVLCFNGLFGKQFGKMGLMSEEEHEERVGN